MSSRAELFERIAALEAERDGLKAQQLSLAMEYDPNCEYYDHEEWLGHMQACRQIVESVQDAAEYLGKDPEGCLTDICDELMGKIENEREEHEAAIEKLRQYASYCKTCAESGQSSPMELEPFRRNMESISAREAI